MSRNDCRLQIADCRLNRKKRRVINRSRLAVAGTATGIGVRPSLAGWHGHTLWRGPVRPARASSCTATQRRVAVPAVRRVATPARLAVAGTATRIAIKAILCLVMVMPMSLLAGCQEKAAPAPPPPAPAQSPQHLATATIHVGQVPLVVEVANTEATRQKGMMFRTRLGPDEAMLFVFGRDSNLTFWMKNTPVDLDLAYIRADGTITQTERMEANVLDPVFSREPVRFALEVPAGWLQEHGVAVGTKVAIPPGVAATRETP